MSRLDIRLTPEQRDIMDRASEIKGFKTTAEYSRTVLLTESNRIIEENKPKDNIQLTEDEVKVLSEILKFGIDPFNEDTVKSLKQKLNIN